MTEASPSLFKRFLATGGQWPLLVVGLLVLQIVLCMAALYFATSDASFAVESDAYQKGLAWDERVEAQAASDALGWTLALSVSDKDNLGRRVLTVTLNDGEGQPITGATIEGRALTAAEASRPVDLKFTPNHAGGYHTTARVARDGWWHIDLTARVADDVYLWKNKRYIGVYR